MSDYPPEAIKGGVLLRVAALLLKYVYDDELEERLPEILSLLRELADKPTVLGHLQTIMRYLSGGKQPFSPTELKDVVDRLFEGETMQKTFLQKRLEEAKQTGLQLGLTKGEQIGLTKGQRQTHIHNIKQTIAIRFAVKAEVYDTWLNKLSIPQLEILSREALLVKQIADFDSQLTPMLTD